MITEILYGLLQKKPPVYIQELCLITTAIGREKIEKELLKKGNLKYFFKEFSLTPVLPEFFIIKDNNGNPLKDILETKDNERVGDFIIGIVREKTRERNIDSTVVLPGEKDHKFLSWFCPSIIRKALG